MHLAGTHFSDFSKLAFKNIKKNLIFVVPFFSKKWANNIIANFTPANKSVLKVVYTAVL